ncbi:hypothetical protein PMAYCL1PPCAC_28223, partial [Pristionchus mayeri]
SLSQLARPILPVAMRLLLFLLPVLLAASPHDTKSTVLPKLETPIPLRTSVAVDSNQLIHEGSSSEFEQPRSRKRTRSISSHLDSSKEDARMYSTNLHGSRTRFLKNKLLDNLNKYFGEESGALEILSSEDPPAPEGSWNVAPAPQPPQQQWGLPLATNPWMQQQQQPQQLPFQQQSIPHAIAPPTGNPWLSWTTPPTPFQQPPFVQPPHPQPVPQVHPTLIPAPPPLDARQQRSEGRGAHYDPKPRLVKQSSWEASAERRNTKTGMRSDTSGESMPQKLSTTQRVTPKLRKRGQSSMNRDTMETIRSWRNRLYKAFKRHDGSNNSLQPTRISRFQSNNTSGGSELLEFANQTPLVADKNLQVLKARDNQPHHVQRHVQQPTFGMDPSGKMTPMFGMERQGYRFAHQPPIPVDYAQQRYIQSPQPFYSTPPPLPEFTYSTHAPYHTLLPRINFPTSSSPEERYFPTQSVSEPTLSPTLPTMLTPPPRSDPPEELEHLGEEDPPPQALTQMSGVTCADGSCNSLRLQQEISEELPPINEDKCNSMRLKDIIEKNVVPNDAEASKRAVQAVAEDVTGRYFDAICGTGFFSYIAHTDEFCQASASGVNCYLFSPVCGNTQSNAIPFKKHRKRTILLNKN